MKNNNDDAKLSVFLASYDSQLSDIKISKINLLQCLSWFLPGTKQKDSASIWH